VYVIPLHGREHLDDNHQGDRVKKKFLIPLLAVIPVAEIGLSATAEAASPSIMISYLYFDSPGSDTRSNTSLNKEYIRVTNTTAKPIQLQGWTIRDKANHVFTFKALTLGAKQSTYIHTGKGTDRKPAQADRYWQSGNYIWNNTGDTAYVRNTAGKTLDSCAFTAKQAPATKC
jgi:hypothetical protein